MSTDKIMTMERVTRSKARGDPKPLNVETKPELKSDLMDESPHCSATNSGRIQQPNVYVLSNFMTVKTEVHYNPIIAPKIEEQEAEVTGDEDVYLQLVLNLRENRKQGKYSEDELCTAAINWLKHQSKERSPKMKELLNEFPGKEHKGRIIQSLFEVPDPELDLQKGAFALLMELYLNQNNDKEEATTPKEHPDIEASRSTPNLQAGSSRSRPQAKKTKLSTSAEKIPNNNGTDQKDSSSSRNDESRAAKLEKALQNTSMSNCVAVFFTRKNVKRPERLGIGLSPTEILMEKVVQGGQNITRWFDSISKLITELETCDPDYEIWLTIVTMDLTSEDVKRFLTKFANAICNLDLAQDEISRSDLQELLNGLPNLINLTLHTIPSTVRALRVLSPIRCRHNLQR